MMARQTEQWTGGQTDKQKDEQQADKHKAKKHSGSRQMKGQPLDKQTACRKRATGEAGKVTKGDGMRVYSKNNIK